jgi:hypothetical protein
MQGTTAAAGPLVVSTATPRYFTVVSDERKAVYLTGSHIWNNFHDGMGPGSECPHTPERLDFREYSTSWKSAATTSSVCGAGNSSSRSAPLGGVRPNRSCT